MHTMIRGIAALGFAGMVSGLALARLVAEALPAAEEPVADYATDGFHTYRFEELEILKKTVFHVDEKYVDPTRLDWERMFGAVLSAVEHAVPSCVFSRKEGGSMVNVEIGEFSTVLEVDPIRSQHELVSAARQVAALIRAHVDPADLPSRDPDLNPWVELEYAMVNGMLAGALDPHSVLLDPRAAADMDDENRGEFGGLGIKVMQKDGWLVIDEVDEGTPAMAVGLQAKDRIARIDGESTLNMTTDDAVTRLRGPVGAPVTLHIQREGREEPLVVDVVRGNIALHQVEGELLQGGVAYVMIPNFHAQAESQLRTTLSLLRREAGGTLRGLVLDLRDNPGGFYREGWMVADAFLEEGVLVSTVDRAGKEVDRKVARSQGAEPRYPMAVLVNPRSASASEIVAGALRNNGRAVIVGQRSFGKGSVQNLHEYHDGSELKLTVSRYLTPGERSIQSVGIPADIEVREATWYAGERRDLRLRLFGDELDSREADLPGALDADALVIDEPAYSLRRLVRFAEDATGPPEPSEDPEVLLARDVLLAAPSWRRADVLAAAAPVVRRHARQGDEEILAAMEELGVDWRDGPPLDPEAPPALELRLEPAQLQAGVRSDLTLWARNTGDRPVYRLSVLASDHDVLAGREFFFGRLEPGEERSWTVRVRPPAGYAAELAPVRLSIRDAGGEPLGAVHREVEILPAARGRLQWTLALEDEDGDGRAEVEERVALHLAVENPDPGPVTGVVARLVNRSGRAVDLLRGNLSIGTPLDADGAACDPEERGTGEEGCRFVLGPGERWEGSFEIQIRDHPPGDEVAVEVQIERRVDHDWAAIVRSELDVYASRERIAIPVAGPLPEPILRRAPAIDITHRPGTVSPGERVTVSGLATDDTGLAHVMVFYGTDKVFHQGAGRSSTLKAIPFTADVELKPGLNTLVVEAVDRDGTAWTESVVTWSGPTELARRE